MVVEATIDFWESGRRVFSRLPRKQFALSIIGSCDKFIHSSAFLLSLPIYFHPSSLWAPILICTTWSRICMYLNKYKCVVRDILVSIMLACSNSMCYSEPRNAVIIFILVPMVKICCLRWTIQPTLYSAIFEQTLSKLRIEWRKQYRDAIPRGTRINVSAEGLSVQFLVTMYFPTILQEMNKRNVEELIPNFDLIHENAYL